MAAAAVSPKRYAINVSDYGTELQLHITDPLPDNFGSWQEPGWQEGRRAGFSTKLPKRDANDLGHARAARGQKLFVVHRFPSGWQRVFRAHPAPLVVADLELRAQTGNVFCRALASHRAVVVPTDISEIRNLIHLLLLRDPVIMQPRLRKQVMHFARRATAPTWSCEQILQWLIAEQRLARQG